MSDEISIINEAILENGQPADYQPSPSEHLYEIMSRQHDDPTIPVPTAFLTGSAGVGKTYTAREIINENPTFAIMAATTGIAGVNLDTTTINALLKYFDTNSLRESYRRGRVLTILHEVAKRFQNILIDEVSMMDKEQLDVLVDAIADTNDFKDMKNHKLGLILTGDFCQLPPIKADFAFNAESWKLFAKNTMRLTKNWRTGDQDFLRALQHLRAGEGPEAVEILKDIVNWRSSVNMQMKDSTVIMAKNDAVQRHNKMMLRDVPGEYINIFTRRAGKQPKPWTDPSNDGLIPDILQLKLGAYVMVLTNAPPPTGGFLSTNLAYANGDCGWVRKIDTATRTVVVELKRNGSLVNIPLITRYIYFPGDPPRDDRKGHEGELLPVEGTDYIPEYNEKLEKWSQGKITYMPLRVAYAATVHKTQGLTLDVIQVDSTAHFFGSPAMAYVALSRARRPEDVYIVGRPESFATKVKIDERVRPWL